jgi:serine/threonine protein kinase
MSSDGDFASTVIAEWRQGRVPDAQQVIADHPELASDKSTVLHLAYEEFCLRTDAGESIDSREYCGRFPMFRSSLARLLEVHHYFSDHPEQLPSQASIGWPDAGEKIIGFTIVRELGRGGIARVYLAQEETLGDRPVVIKVSRGGAKEAETLGKLVHPHIVPVHSVQQDPISGFTVVCMPFLGETTLCDVLDRAFQGENAPSNTGLIRQAVIDDDENTRSADQIPILPRNYVDTVVDIGIQLADALSYTHSLGILHRDIKPSNILVERSGKVMLLDFNLSADARSNGRPLGGTLPYMAPEHMMAVFFSEATDGIVDARSDIYSLGVVLYELLTGTRPFESPLINEPSRQAVENLLARIAKAPIPIRERNPDVDSKAAEIIHRCLAEAPQRRFQSAADLIVALRSHRSTRQRVQRWIHRYRKPIAGTAVPTTFAMLITIGLVLNRPPLKVREFNAGLTDYSNGAFSGAFDHFTTMLAEDPTSQAAHFARGQALVQLGNYDGAIQEFKSIQQHPTDGRLLACLAYCYGRNFSHPNAILLGEEAIASNCNSAAVLNNLGRSYMDLSRLNKAQQCFNKAISLDPHFALAYHNRVQLDRQLALRDGQLPPKATRDVEMALAIDAKNPWLLLDAGYIYALASRQVTNHDAKAINFLQQAVELGLDYTAFASDPVFIHLQQMPEFKLLLQRTAMPRQISPRPLFAIPYSSAELK